MLTTSARPSESFPPNLDYIDLDNQLMAVADKEQRYSGTIGRYLPFNNFLRDEIQHYLKYLKHFLHLTALLHKHSKAEFSPIHSNLRHNLGARST